ncbi:unnamed protein product, partial [Ectocarpus sp. 8 AP-2014]
HYRSPNVADPEKHKERLDAAKATSKASSTKPDGQQTTLPEQVKTSREDSVARAVLDWVILSNQSLSAVEHPAF